MSLGSQGSFFLGSSGQGGGAGYEIERSLRFNSADSPYLNRVFGTATSTTTFSISMWVKRVEFSQATYLFVAGTGTQGYFNFDADIIRFYGVNGDLKTNAKYRDPSAWYHIVGVADTSNATADDRMRLYVNGVQLTNANGDFSTYTQPSQGASLGDWNSAATHYVNRLSAGNYQNFYLADFQFIDGQALSATDFGKYDSNSVWQPKAFAGTYGTNGFKLDFSDISSDAALGTDSSGNNNTWTVNNLTANAIDYASNYSLTGSLYGPTYSPDKLFDGSTTTPVLLLNSSSTLTYTFDTPIAFTSTFEVYYTNGVSATTMDINGVSQTINDNYATREWLSASGITSPVTSLSWSGTNGANGPYMYAVRVDGDILIGSPVSENDALRDSPVNGDSANDTGAGGEITGNYCTLNPLAEQTSGSITLSNGNLTATVGSTRSSFFGTMALEGKTYWEIVFTGGAYVFGMADASMFNTTANTAPNRFIGETSTSWSIGDDGTVYNNGATQGTETSWTNGDVMGWSYDSSNGAIKIYKNGTLNGSYTASTANTYFPAATLISSGASVNVNFGQRAFSHPVSDYKALCTANLPDPTIADGSTAFDAVTYAGNGGTQSITNYNFSPSFVWIKDRTSTGSHVLQDTVRGTDSYLMSNETAAENNSTNYVTSFNADGFSIGNGNRVNNGSRNYVAWAWDAGEANTTIAVGGLNSLVYNQSAVWSSGTFSPAASDTGTETRAFNGQLTLQGGYFNGGGTWTPSSPITFYNQVEILDSVDQKYAINGGTQVAINIGSWTTIASTTAASGATLNTINFTRISDAATTHTWQGLKIDGKLLVDSDVTPPNVPSIESTVRANPSAGVSIVSYTPTASTGSIAHGLNAAPDFVLCKRTDDTGDWWAGHVGAGWTEGGYLQVGDAFTALSGFWNDTAPDSNIVTLGSYPTAGSPTATYISYCFTSVNGFSKQGKYVGNSEATDGPFVYTGFRVEFLLLKGIDGAHYWAMHDSARNPYNSNDFEYLWANDAGGTGTGYDLDFLSNGFKIRNSNGNWNNSGQEYIYIAFASHPFQTARAR